MDSTIASILDNWLFFASGSTLHQVQLLFRLSHLISHSSKYDIRSAPEEENLMVSSAFAAKWPPRPAPFWMPRMTQPLRQLRRVARGPVFPALTEVTRAVDLHSTQGNRYSTLQSPSHLRIHRLRILSGVRTGSHIPRSDKSTVYPSTPRRPELTVSQASVSMNMSRSYV